MSFLHFNSNFFIVVKMSSHQMSAKPRSSKCRHFCFPFDSHKYCPTSGNLARETTPVSLTSLHAMFVQVSLRNSKLRLNIDVGTSGNRSHRILVILARKMILTYWVTMWRRFLALKQTLRVLLKICFLLLPVPNPYVSNLYH